MSLESALDEEVREVMNLLEGRPSQYGSSSNTVGGGRTSSSVPPVRSMLDIGPMATGHSSIPVPAVGAMNLPIYNATSNRSRLDPPSSPTLPSNSVSTGYVHHRAQSDASSTIPALRPRASSDRERAGGALPYAENQFDMTSIIHGQALPKRVTQGGKKGLGISSMASIMQGQELDPLPMTRDRGRHNSTAGIIGVKSKSPSSRLSNRSDSPGGTILNTNSFNLMSTPGKFVTDGGKVIDLSNAYRRLSDANLLKSGGHLSSLPTRTATARARTGETLSPTGETRLQKDYYENDENGEAAIESSDEERSSEDEAWGPQSARGRRRGRQRKDIGGNDVDNEDNEKDRRLRNGPAKMGQTGGPRMVKSLLGAAEEERECNSSQFDNKKLTIVF